MRRSLNALTGGTIVLLLALAGCGSSNPKAQTADATQTASTSSAATTAATPSVPAKTNASSEPPPAARMQLTSPVFKAGRPLENEERAISSRFTCDGADVSPPMHWSGVPKGAAELLMVILDLEASQTSGHGRFFAWAIAGLKPSLHGLSTGKLPAGAVVGRNGFGQNRYSVCPPKGSTQNYLIFFYASPHKLSLKPGFDADALYMKLAHANLPEGQSGFAYQRR